MRVYAPATIGQCLGVDCISGGRKGGPKERHRKFSLLLFSIYFYFTLPSSSALSSFTSAAALRVRHVRWSDHLWRARSTRACCWAVRAANLLLLTTSMTALPLRRGVVALVVQVGANTIRSSRTMREKKE
uniref:(northern house mosquito) hypothetical protein n=1 Tax=Culex pipiens TaxID=7175 RepID=A0A8D8GNB8_CULPI